ncbi:hypothetical protein CTAYLR_003576 [Chrysophaeum taylorii]|uniref:Uncharacterized protein n=1 Tax=Chrysophaeum taylorii TaxID=2483200 RepID=A0AAD7XQG0_9STRA|nr:hypothetical protein CTAYLR_003576 [Chrysophaeum taylorii]
MGQGNSKADLADILVTLSQTDVSPEAHDFWDDLWRLGTSPEDVFELISPDDVRRLKTERPENLVTLFTQAVAQLCQIVHTPIPMYFGQALNCVRILTRLLPFLLEVPGDPFVERLCWSVEEDDHHHHHHQGEEEAAPEPLARLVVHAAMHLLFLPGFTVDATAFEEEEEEEERSGEKRNGVTQSALWAAGIGGFEARPAIASTFDRNRIEVLRLLLAATCEPLYQTADAYDPWASRWLAVATARDAPNARLLFYSLLNVIFSYDPTGFGLPYGGALASEAPALLVTASAQVAIALLDYGASAQQQEQGANVFRELLADLSPDTFEFIFDGLARLLNNVHEALNTTLPGSLQQIDCYQELLVLLWKCLEENTAFMPYVLRNCDVTRLVVPVCFLQYQARRDPARVGLVHICTFILLKFSGERPFCVALNKPFAENLPIDLPIFDGSHADLVIITLHKMVVNGGEKLAALYNCFLTIVCNLSPYAKTLSLVASVKLVNLFELFTSPRFLYQAETNHVYVALLLEIFNNIIQYQYSGNPHLVYAIVRRKVVVDQLEQLTLPTAIANSKDGASEAAPALAAANSRRPQETKAEKSIEKNTTHAAVDATVKAEAEPSPVSAKPPRFTPTAEWLERVKAELPLNTITRLLQHLGPQLDELVSRSEFALDETQILDFIKNTTMVGLLPVPHAIVIRKYQPNNFTQLWFTAFLWGVIFLQNQLLPLFDGNTVKLFTVSVVN